MANKAKIAIFDLTGCEGCEFHLLSLDELLLDFFQDFEIAHWRLLSQEQKADFDIAFIEGAATTKEHIKLLKQIRKTSKIVVALGACAITGNVFAQLSPEKRKIMAKKIYDKNYKLKAEFLEPVGKFIKTDKIIPGCPPDIESIKKLLGELKKERGSSFKKKVAPPAFRGARRATHFVAKIEGHGKLKINFKKKTATFQVQESERLVEGLLLDRDFAQAPLIASRICGICPIAHNLCSWSAIENALKIKPSAETVILRKILLASQIIKSHLLHLFFLVLPSQVGIENSLELTKKFPAEFHLMLNIKRIADEILKVVGGSSAFPTNTILGGFGIRPAPEKLLAIKEKIADVLDEAENIVSIFGKLKMPKFSVQTRFATTCPEGDFYPLYPGNFPFKIKETVQKNSTAKLAFIKEQNLVKVGALARISLFSQKLNPKAKKVLKRWQPDFNNPFNNNISQAIEILHFLEETMRLIEKLAKSSSPEAKNAKKFSLPRKTVSGTAFLEAPRGILKHEVRINNKGKIAYYNIIPPTQINLMALAKEAQELLLKQKGSSPELLRKQIEELIRSFDPCITCAVH